MKAPIRTLIVAETGFEIYIWEEPAPGLAITSRRNSPGRRGYDVTHVPTGRRIASVLTKRQARLLAQKIAPLTAWHRRRSVESLERDKALGRAVADVRREMLP